MIVAFLGGLGKAPTFLVPIINPPFADNSPHSNPRGGCITSEISRGPAAGAPRGGEGHSA